MINSIRLPTLKTASSTLCCVLLALSTLYLLTQLYNENTAISQNSTAAINIHKSNTPVTLPLKESRIRWKNMEAGAFNLGVHQYALVQLSLTQAQRHSVEGLIIAIAKNNIFTDAILHYQQGNLLIKKQLSASTSDNKLLSIKVPDDALLNPLHLSLSGRYLRGELLIYTPIEFAQYIKNTAIKDGVYVGIAALFLLSSILAYLVLQKSIFIKYAALLTSMFLWIAAGEGWLISYFPQLQNLAFFTANSLGLLFFITFAYFSYDYLKLNHYVAKTGLILKYSQWLLLIIWLCYCLSFNQAEPSLYQAAYALALVTCFVVLNTAFISAMRSLPNHGKQAKFYLAALGVFLLCGVISGLSMTNIIDFHVGWTLIKTSSLAEMILLATGLMYWYQNSMNKLINEQKQYNAAQAELISTKQQLAEKEALLITQPSSTPPSPQIAKVIALLDKTLYIKAAGNYCDVIYQDKETVKEALIDTKLQAIEAALGTDKLIRCHRSYLINVRCKFMLTRRTSADYDLVLAQHRIPVGRKYLKDIQRRFSQS